MSLPFAIAVVIVFMFDVFGNYATVAPSPLSQSAQVASATAHDEKKIEEFCQEALKIAENKIESVQCQYKKTEDKVEVKGHCTKAGTCLETHFKDLNGKWQELVTSSGQGNKSVGLNDMGIPSLLSPEQKSAESNASSDNDRVSCALGYGCAPADKNDAPRTQTTDPIADLLKNTEPDDGGERYRTKGTLNTPDAQTFSQTGEMLRLTPFSNGIPEGTQQYYAPTKESTFGSVDSPEVNVDSSPEEPRFEPDEYGVTQRHISVEEAQKNLDNAKLYQQKVLEASSDMYPDRYDPAFQRAQMMRNDAEYRVAKADVELVYAKEGISIPTDETAEGPRPPVDQFDQNRALYDAFAKAVPESIAVGNAASQLEASDKAILKDISQWAIDRGIETPQLVQNNLKSYIENGDFPGLDEARTQSFRGEGSLAGAARTLAADAGENAKAYWEAVPKEINSWSDLGSVVANGSGWLAESTLEATAKMTSNLLGRAGFESFNPPAEVAFENAVNPNKATANLILDASGAVGLAYPIARGAADAVVDAGIAAVREGVVIAGRDIADTVGQQAYREFSSAALDQAGATGVKIAERSETGAIPYLVENPVENFKAGTLAPSPLAATKDDVLAVPHADGNTVYYDAQSGRPFMMKAEGGAETQLITPEGRPVGINDAVRLGEASAIIETPKQYQAVSEEVFGSKPISYSAGRFEESTVDADGLNIVFKDGVQITNADGKVSTVDRATFDEIRGIGDDMHGVTAMRSDLAEYTSGKFELNSPGLFGEDVRWSKDFTDGTLQPMSPEGRAELLKQVEPLVKALPEEFWQNSNPVRLHAFEEQAGKSAEASGFANSNTGKMWLKPSNDTPEQGRVFFHELQHTIDQSFPPDEAWAKAQFGEGWARAYGGQSSDEAISSGRLGYEYRPEGFTYDYGYFGGVGEQKATFVESLFTNPSAVEYAALTDPGLAKQLSMTKEVFSNMSNGVMDEGWWRNYKPLDLNYQLPPVLDIQKAEAVSNFLTNTVPNFFRSLIFGPSRPTIPVPINL